MSSYIGKHVKLSTCASHATLLKKTLNNKIKEQLIHLFLNQDVVVFVDYKTYTHIRSGLHTIDQVTIN